MDMAFGTRSSQPPLEMIICGERIAGGFGLDPLVRAAGTQFGRIDAAQPHLGGDIDARPDAHAGLERVAVEHPQELRRVSGSERRPALRRRRTIRCGRGRCGSGTAHGDRHRDECRAKERPCGDAGSKDAAADGSAKRGKYPPL